MNRKLLTGCAALLVWHAVAAQDSLKVWTLQTCLDYALENNIQLQQSRNDYLSGLEDTREAKAALLPSLAVSATQGYTNYPSSNAEDNNSYTGTYGINAGLTLYEGGKLRTAVKEQRLQNRIDALSVAESANDIRIAIVEAYMQALYAAEAVEVAAGTAEVSRAQRDRAEQMWQAGSISKVDFAQLESQYASDLYQVVVARSSLDDYKLQLKQLLELDITEEMNLAAPASQGEETVLSGPARQSRHLRHGARRHARRSNAGRLAVEIGGVGHQSRRAQDSIPPFPSPAGLGTGTHDGRRDSTVGTSGLEPLQRERRALGQHPDLLQPQEPHGRQQGAHRRLEQPSRAARASKRSCSARSSRPTSTPSRPNRSYDGRPAEGTALCPAELRPHRRAVPCRPEEHRRADHGAERTDGRPAGGVCRPSTWRCSTSRLLDIYQGR
ncbi:TolC family protein [Alistipes communis]|uniref:TolC family protein n=1 Tax=Alistipes communis TaxID=2585118 RepID=UPI0024311EBA|nr:TolC family protein [Alistipes communis]